jgi:hypothetical protein
VDATESALGIDPENRPVYAYVGDLHPALGKLGLVIARSWTRDTTGVSKCDSGGLGGRRGAFESLAPQDAVAALRDLSYGSSAVARWEADFTAEMSCYQSGAAGYVRGEEPATSAWNDARSVCIRRASPPRDRRLWTWEVRQAQGPRQEEYVALVLSHETAKVLDDLVRSGASVPESVRVLRGDINPSGAEFQLESARAALEGA